MRLTPRDAVIGIDVATIAACPSGWADKWRGTRWYRHASDAAGLCVALFLKCRRWRSWVSDRGVGGTGDM